jgi:hypothetical protein
MSVVQEWFRKWYFVPLLIFISALAYLPHIRDFGYYRDDWYLMYSANALGGSVFKDIYAIDRPARAVLMSFVYSLFGSNPLFYNLSAYVFRVLGALAFLWTLRMLWPRQRLTTLIAATLFLIYPGFLSSPNAIDYQAQQIGLFLAHFSIALNVKAVSGGVRCVHLIVLWLLSILMAWMYLGFVEYFLGLEVFRLAAIAVFAGRSGGIRTWQWVKKTLFTWLPFSIGPLGFVIWRFFIFSSERKATDLGAQLGVLMDSPLLVGSGWVVTLLKDVFESIVLSWGVPFSNFWDTPERLREFLFSGVLAVLSFFAVLMLLRLEKDEVAESSSNTGDDLWQTEAFWLGLVCVVAGFVPVILSNRNADFGNLSRYMLASSSGAALLIGVFISQFNSRSVRMLILCLLIGQSVLTHYFNGIQWARASEGMREFWWQVSWRIPQLEAGTTLVANYSHTAIEEDYFIWGPANLLYRPQSLDPVKIRPALWGMVLSQESVSSILTKAAPDTIDRRTILAYADYGNVLVLTQPTPLSCVQVLDGRLPSVSEYEQYDIRSVAGESDQSHILLNEQAPPPSVGIFGKEPEHSWCYYYEKASLAYQRGKWKSVLDLGEEAQKMEFSPQDPVEWMPFIQAALYLNDLDTAYSLAPKVKRSPFLAAQACEVLKDLPELNIDTKNFVEDVFCALGD